jgi:hypothetical protein
MTASPTHYVQVVPVPPSGNRSAVRPHVRIWQGRAADSVKGGAEPTPYAVATAGSVAKARGKLMVQTVP